MRLSFIIATRNRRDSLARCIDSIESQSHADRETLVVIDGSTDGTAEMLAHRYPSVRVIELGARGGVGGALSTGSAQATGQVWMNLDDDTLLASPAAAAAIVATFDARPEIDVVCCRVEAPDGSIRHREIPLRSKRMPSNDTEIGYFLGGAVAFRADALRAAGGYPADIVYGSWENDVAFRLFKHGSRTLLTPGVRVIHYAIPSPQNTDEREANYVRNEIRIAATYLPAPYAQVHASLWIALCLAQAIARGHGRTTLMAARQALAGWRGLRRDGERRLSHDEARRLSRLSGRTWY